MRHNRPALFLVGTVIALHLGAQDSLGCTCVGPYDAKTMRDVAIWQSERPDSPKVVFEGLVEAQELETGSIGGPSNAMSMTLMGAHRVVTIRVLRAYHGVTRRTVTLLTGFSGADCGFDFETGKAYLVYADWVDANSLFTSICTGTEPLEQAETALRFLRGERPTPDDLLDPDSYYKEFAHKWTGTACGRVTRPDGSPLGKASVDMTQVRDEPFPPKAFADQNLAKPDGSYCINHIAPGKYLLTADKRDYKTDSRWMGYYPGVGSYPEAQAIEVRAGTSLSNLDFTVRSQPLFTVSFRIVTPEGNTLDLPGLYVTIDSVDRDPLGYHLAQHSSEKGRYTVGYVPPGHYRIRTLVQPDFQTGSIPAELAKWKMVEQEVAIEGDTRIVLMLKPVN